MHSIEDVVREIYALGRVNRELQRRAVPEHPPACLQALGVIARGEAVRVSDIAERLRIDLSVASRQVAVLEASGWVTRTIDPADGRARTLATTDAGRAVLADTLARMADAYIGVLEGWSEDELDVAPDRVGAPARGLRARVRAGARGLVYATPSSRSASRSRSASSTTCASGSRGRAGPSARPSTTGRRASRSPTCRSCARYWADELRLAARRGRG